MENIVFERNYEKPKDGSDHCTAIFDQAVEGGFFQRYCDMMNKVPKIIVPQDKENYEYLLSRCNQYAEQHYGRIRGVVSYERWDSTIDLYLPMLEFDDEEDIVHKSKERDGKVIENFKKYFLPEKYLDSYLKIADFMTNESIENIVNSVFAGGKIEGVNNSSRILFIHGTKGNEILSKKAAKLMKRHYPETEIICFKGDAHCYKAIYEPEIWITAVNDFLQSM